MCQLVSGIACTAVDLGWSTNRQTAQATDKDAVSADVNSGLRQLKAEVVAHVTSAMEAVRSSLNARLSQLSAAMTAAKAGAHGDEDALKSRMAALEQRESNDDAAQVS